MVTASQLGLDLTPTGAESKFPTTIHMHVLDSRSATVSSAIYFLWTTRDLGYYLETILTL
jgi:hypothetical protein